MSGTRTFFIDLKRLSLAGVSASLIIRLMMAVNDISLANNFLLKFKGLASAKDQYIRKGALMYCVRLMCGHLYEAISMIKEIEDDPYLSSLFRRCSQTCQDEFKKLKNCLKGGPDNKKFERFVGRIRNNTAFHYDESNKLVRMALMDRAGRAEARLSKITLADDINYVRFELADDIIDSIVCRQICEIPRSADLRQEIDNWMDWGNELCKSFVILSGEFLARIASEYSAR
jgi:hypothetical protein